MDLKESIEFRRKTKRVPSNVVVASDQPFELGERIEYGELFFRVLEELTAEEFFHVFMSNLEVGECAQGQADCVNGRVDLEKSTYAEYPRTEQKYFYLLILEPE